MCYNEREYRRKSTPESCIEIQFKGVKSMIKVGFIDYYLDEWHAVLVVFRAAFCGGVSGSG